MNKRSYLCLIRQAEPSRSSASYEKTNLTLMRDEDIRKCLGTTIAGNHLCSL